jgi:predicted nucleic acid-binding protein
LKRFVLDASVALAWFIDNPAAPFAQHVGKELINGGHAVVPALWHLEVANGLLVAERRGSISAADADRANEQIADLLATSIQTAGDLVSIKQALATARAFHLSAYDAVYIEMSLRQRLPLATLDKRLRTAAVKAGIDTMH